MIDEHLTKLLNEISDAIRDSVDGKPMDPVIQKRMAALRIQIGSLAGEAERLRRDLDDIAAGFLVVKRLTRGRTI